MYPEVESHVLKAADAFRAAAIAGTPEDRRLHLKDASDWVMLIQCKGSEMARRVLKARTRATGHR